LRSWVRLSRLSGVEARLLAEALGWVALARLALWFLPFRTTWAACRRLARAWRRRPSPPPPDLIEEAVRRACRLVPAATCLPRSLAFSVMLGRYGYPAQVRLGAARDGERFLAHAWVERDPASPGGHAAARRYSAFPALGDPLR
jgi:hypothetical protein